MDELSNSVNAGQGAVVEPSTEPAVEVNAEVAGVSVEVVPAEQPPEPKPTAQSAEENAKYAAIRRKAEAEASARAKDAAAAEIAAKMGWTTPDGKPISTFSEFETAKAESDMIAQGLDPKVVREIIQNDPMVRQAKELLAKTERETKDRQEHLDFFTVFKAENGREFNAATDADVYAKMRSEAEKTGKSFADAYTKVRFEQLKAEKQELETKLKAQQTNAANAASSPGAVGSEGAPVTDEFITPELFEKNRKDPEWVRTHFNQIMKSRPKWA